MRTQSFILNVAGADLADGTRTAIKALKKMPKKDSGTVMAKLENYAAGGSEDVARLQNSPYYRLRHGDWRAVFTQDGKVIAVQNVAKRGKVYR